MDIFGPWIEDESVAEQIEVKVKYAGYIDRQQLEIDKQLRYENCRIPANVNYADVNGLSNEVRQKFSTIKPDTVGMAARIPGITPAAISILLVHLKKTA